jgi:hypothetical protein
MGDADFEVGKRLALEQVCDVDGVPRLPQRVGKRPDARGET